MTDPDDRKPRRESVVALRRCQKMVSLHVPCLLPAMPERSRDGGHERWPPFAHAPLLVCSTEPGAREPVQRPSDAEAVSPVPSRSSPYCGLAAEDNDDSRRTGCVQPSAVLLDERHIHPGHRQPEVHALAHTGEVNNHALVVLHGRCRRPTAHGDAGSRPDILPLEICHILQVIDVAHTCGLFDPHGDDIEATDLKLML